MKQMTSAKQAREIKQAGDDFWAAASDETRKKYLDMTLQIMKGDKAAIEKMETELMDYHQGHVHFFTLGILDNAFGLEKIMKAGQEFKAQNNDT